MAVRMRLAMHGLRHRRVFHLVTIDQELRRNAKPIETLGVFNPQLTAGEQHKTVEWSVDRIKYWLNQGAQPSPSVVKLLTMGGILSPDSKYHQATSKSKSKGDTAKEIPPPSNAS